MKKNENSRNFTKLNADDEEWSTKSNDKTAGNNANGDSVCPLSDCVEKKKWNKISMQSKEPRLTKTGARNNVFASNSK